jgi:hypothetical protein
MGPMVELILHFENAKAMALPDRIRDISLGNANAYCGYRESTGMSLLGDAVFVVQSQHCASAVRQDECFCSYLIPSCYQIFFLLWNPSICKIYIFD